MTIAANVFLVGLSRAGVSVARAFERAGACIAGAWNRSERAGPGEWPLATGPVAPDLDGVDIVLMAVSDDALGETAGWLARNDASPNSRCYVHLSGCHGADLLTPAADAGARTAALHPLRSFPTPDLTGEGLRGAVCALDAGSPEDARLLTALAEAAGGEVVPVDGGRRARYHLGATIASNLVVALVDSAVRQLVDIGFDEEQAQRALGSLATGTIRSIVARGCGGAATGPIVRGDVSIVARHLDALEDDPATRRIYCDLSLRLLDLLRRSGRSTDAHGRIGSLLGEEEE